MVNSLANRPALLIVQRFEPVSHPAPPGIGLDAEHAAAVSHRFDAHRAFFVCITPLGRPRTPAYVVARVEAFASTMTRSIRQIHQALGGRVSRSIVGEIVKRVRHPS